EYIASLIVSFLIILVGFELLRGSLDKIFHYEPSAFSWLSVGIMLFSVLVKLWMFVYNRYIGQRIQSVVIRAAAQDSLNDVYATGAVVVSLFLGRMIQAPVDGIMGLAISVLIMFTGYGIARDTITILLGAPPDPAVAERICDMILQQEGIDGVHDLIIHDYGPGRRMASVHAEVPVDGDIVKVHEIIDATEKQIEKEMGVHIVIHMDPIMVNCQRAEEIRQFALDCVHEVNPVFGIHDFRMTDGEQNINLIFDLEVPYSLKPAEREAALAAIKEKLRERDERFNPVIQVDNKL
ncbi:MAG: cation diffusion facilitator family transporter, partial [Clostridia bacterium]